MFPTLDLLLGRVGIPEGFTSALGGRYTFSAGNVFANIALDRGYYFLLRELRAHWVQPTHASYPRLEIFRDLGDRAYQAGTLGQHAIDLTNLSSPGAQALATCKLKRVVPLNFLFPPGSILQIKISGIVSADPTTIDLAAIGRYVKKPPEGMQ